MISTTYRYPKSLTVRVAVERTKPLRHLWTNFIHYFWRNLALGIAIMLSDLWFGNGMATVHIVVPVILISAVLAIVARQEWLAQVSETTEDLDLVVELDERGVKSRWVSLDVFNEWDFYREYEEQSDVVKFMHRDGGISYVPRTPETEAVIAYAKSRVPPRTGRVDN